MVIKPEAIPEFGGDLGAVETHAAALKSAGGTFRTTGQNVHSTWQGLSAFYDAPEAAQLFGMTAQVQTGADAVADDIEEVGAALAQYAATVRPIANRLTALKGEAGAFVSSIDGDDDWREDGDKVNRNNQLISQVDTQVAALMAAERETANRINRLYGGPQWTVDDGSDKAHAYGFDAGQLPGDAERPWGKSEEKDEPWYVDTWNAVWSGGKGVVVDGLWGDVKGLFGLINPFDWDTFSASWGGLWTLTGGLIFDTENSFKAWKEFGKSFLAWDEWSKDPARAFGNVLYNVVTLPLAAAKVGTLGKAGKGAAAGADAGKAADAAKAGNAAADAGKVGDLGKLGDDLGNVADVGKVDDLPTVGDLAKQIDAALGDVVKADPALELALKQADDIAASADRATPGDDLVGRGEQPPVRVEEPALAGAGRGGGPTGVDLPPPGARGGGYGPLGDLGDVGRGLDDAGDAGRGLDDAGDAGRGLDDAGDAGRGLDDAGDAGRGADDAGDGAPRGDGGPGGGGDEPPNRPDEPDAGDGPDPQRPQNDPDLDKHDPATLAEIQKARKEVAGRLQEMSDEAWDYVEQNKDTLLQKEGYQRQYEAFLERYPEPVAREIVERTALGTEAHSYLARAIDAEAAGMLDESSGFRLRSEVGYDANGIETPRVRDQEFRPDVILEREVRDPVTGDLEWEVVHAYDLKTGLKTGIKPGWSEQVKRLLNLPDAPEELRPTQRPLGG
ncbi:hypothetical protein [Couchioplanes azureus]|uniref:hypothetical protein n=1 Tax=Couchioplanes caeruleus TaxID=56438 RepID=UPI00167154B9|nr:hypothetical protein [Couchioplanes caeruleus]GGQ71392.1 hypothetical protein GCM10010166_46910 [Couchioplanes caeruleus subsp. azureus]